MMMSLLVLVVGVAVCGLLIVAVVAAVWVVMQERKR